MSTYLKFAIDDDLCYEGNSWQDMTKWQDDQGQDEILHFERFRWLLLFFFFEWNFICQQTSLEWEMSNCLIVRYILPVGTSSCERWTVPRATISYWSCRRQNQSLISASFLCCGATFLEQVQTQTILRPPWLPCHFPWSSSSWSDHCTPPMTWFTME